MHGDKVKALTAVLFYCIISSAGVKVFPFTLLSGSKPLRFSANIKNFRCDFMDKLGRIALLFDIYGSLLTEKQRTLLDMFYNEDLSLGEIAEINQTSRQAVFDNIKRSEKTLEHYEVNLGLLARNFNENVLLEKLRQGYLNKDWQAVKNVIDLLQTVKDEDAPHIK